jgi:hypothetical protein
MRCPDCSKFVSMDFSDPELQGELEFDEAAGLVTGTVRIERTCAECGTTLKEGELELEGELEDSDADRFDAHLKAHAEHSKIHGGSVLGEFGVEEDGIDPIEEGGGRYKKSYYGAVVNFTIKCSCDPNFAVSGSMEDKMPASAMDEVA